MKKIEHPSRQVGLERGCWATLLVVSAIFLGTEASGLETIYLAITPSKNFQHIIYPIAQEKGYMREEGIELKILIIGGTPAFKDYLPRVSSLPSPAPAH